MRLYNALLTNYILDIIVRHFEDNLINIYKYTFEKDMMTTIKNYLDINDVQEVCHNYIIKHIDKALSIYYLYYMPKRSFKNNHSVNIPNVCKIEKKINEIKEKPQPEQRTEEWYRFRYDLITASNAYKIFGTQSKKNEIICEKCAEFTTRSNQTANLDSPMHWGVRYEPLSVMYYEYYYNAKVEDFGCIQHSEYKFLGASPDGIIVNDTSKLFGRMLEIKNPKSRIITGIPKDEYWIQMQLQMEVCDLNYCDFLETKFIEYDNYNKFMEDGLFNISESGHHKGIILHFVKDQKSYYFYPEFNCGKRRFKQWEEDTLSLKDYEGYEWIQNIYWKLEHVSCVLVLRNKQWFNKAVVGIADIWNIIEKERIDKTWVERKAKKNRKAKTILPKIKPLIIDIDI